MYCKTSVFHSMNLEISNFLGQLVKPKFLFLVQKPKFLITTTQFLRQKKSVQQFFSNHNFYFLVNMVFYTIINMVIYCFSMLFTSARFFFFLIEIVAIRVCYEIGFHAITFFIIVKGFWIL